MRTLLLPLFLLAAPALARPQGGPPPPPPPLPPVPQPLGNPITPAKANLGMVLFWDEQLSSNRAVACGTCHIPGEGGSDPRTSAQNPAARHPGPDGLLQTPDDILGSPGLVRRLADGSYQLDPTFGLDDQVTDRKAPSMILAAYAPTLFWDGRASGPLIDPLTGAPVLNGPVSLEVQALGPPLSEVEMSHAGRTWSGIADEIATFEPLRMAASLPPVLSAWIAGRDYPQLFQEAFGTPDVTPVRIAMAIATYERTLVSNQAPFDAFIAGVPGALTQQEMMGWGVFNGPGLCNTCHVGPRLTNDAFEYIGVRPQLEDLGRFAVTGNLGDRGRMKVPSLRNVELRAPYFHNGSQPTLAAVVDFYNRGGDFAAPNKHPNIRPLGLAPQQTAALVALLSRPLTDARVAQQTGPFARPILYSESNRRPTHFGAPTAGSGGFEPRIISIDPPALGNRQMTVGIDRALGGRVAGLLVSAAADPLGTPFQGATLYAMLGPSTVHRVPSLGGSAQGEGWGSVTLEMPTDPVYLGSTLYMQWLVLDPVSALQRLAASEATSMLIF